MELREFGRDTLLGSTVDWITSGIPISQPEPPEELTRELLAEHDQHLFSDSSARPLYSQSARPWLRVQKR